MDGGWGTGGQKFKRRILDVSIYADPFSFISTGKYKYFFKLIILIELFYRKFKPC